MALGKAQKATLELLWVSPGSGYCNKVYLDMSANRRPRKNNTYPVVVEAINESTRIKLRSQVVAHARIGDDKKLDEIYTYLGEITDNWLERIPD